jgi:hypothetical protein
MATHRINRAEIELHVGEVALAEHLIERLSLLRERRIAPLIDRVCSELSGPEGHGGPVRHVRIDQLELELGSIAVDDFEDDFLRKLEAALRAALSKRMSEQGRAEGPERASIELLEIFARTGNVPWWADRGEPGLVARHVRVLLAAAPHELMRLLGDLSDDEPALARIAAHCDDALLDQIVAGTHAGTDAALLAGIHELERLLADGENTPGRAGAIRARGAMLAALARIDTRAPERVLGAVLHELARSSPVLWDALTAGEPPATSRLREAMSSIRAGLAFPGPEQAPGREHESVNARAEADRVAGRASEHTRRDAGTLDERDASLPDDRPVAHEHPVAVPGREQVEPGEPAHLAAGKRSEVLTNRDTPLPVTPSGDDTPGLERPAPAPAARMLVAPAPALATPARDPRETAVARRRALDQLDELYVDDAGLVILWPFLDRFFLHVGLLDHDRRFLDEHAPMQAIALLSQLATEVPEPPEFRLPLAKLLCGLAPEAPFALERPLAPAQLAECDRLLAAVIDHASILRDMPVASFRATFLQRPGVLGIRDGAWLLRVDRQSHDLVLDRFPWSWSWVKLPWMPDPLRVEW